MSTTKSPQKFKASSGVNWSQYGLISNPSSGYQQQYGADGVADSDFVMQGGVTRQNELFHENQDEKPWWKTNFFFLQPVLFGTWDGVYTSCVIHLFGVITFLRAGWIVGNAGIGLSILIVLTSVTICSIAALAGIGILQRCSHLNGCGTVHVLISNVLGAQLGGAISIIYCFGQAVSCALHVMGFAESMAQILNLNDEWLERMVGIIFLMLLLIINIAGVKWVVRLQLVLFIFITLAALDFAIGTFTRYDPDVGVIGYSMRNVEDNWKPKFENPKVNLFTVYGVFFPAVTGVFAGINMSGDLSNPTRDIPIGTFVAIGTSFLLYLLFICGLGATCFRPVLLQDYFIAQKVSAVGIFFLAGLYISSLSSVLGSLYATPRIIQNIASENIIPIISVLSQGRGPNKTPIYATLVFTMVSICFILIGNINVLAPIMTIPYLLTYAAVEYAYFSLAMTFDIQISRETRFMATTDVSSPTFDTSSKSKGTKLSNYGSVKSEDLDRLFPERVKHERIIIKRQQSSQSSSGSSPLSSPEERASVKSNDNSLQTEDSDMTLDPKPDVNEIKCKEIGWYSVITNRWIILTGAIIKLLIMVLVQWGYALSALISVCFLWFYIGQSNPGVFPGISEFKLFPWIKTILLRCIGKRSHKYDQIILPTGLPNMDLMPAQLTKESSDYAAREKYHQSASATSQLIKSSGLNESD